MDSKKYEQIKNFEPLVVEYDKMNDCKELRRKKNLDYLR